MAKNTLGLLSLLILLCGDVELNPGPISGTFNVCTLNIMSLTNAAHYTALACIAEAHHIDLFALTETWITPSTTSAELLESKPDSLIHSYSFIIQFVRTQTAIKKRKNKSYYRATNSTSSNTNL